DGKRAALVRVPDRHATIVILTNDATADARGMAERLLKQLLAQAAPARASRTLRCGSCDLDCAEHIPHWLGVRRYGSNESAARKRAHERRSVHPAFGSLADSPARRGPPPPGPGARAEPPALSGARVRL